jgi:hypothetical protein
MPRRSESPVEHRGERRVTLAVALQIRDRHGVTLDGTCISCLPLGTAWPCLPFQRAALAAGEPPPVHPDWADGHD